jgi:hypothetical protein
LPSDFFDGVYSAGSIEHFGSLEAVAAAAEEIGRILKPGGVAVLTTEFRLDGPNDRPWFSDDCILFTPPMLHEHIIGPSGLTLIGEPNFSTSQQTFDNRAVLVEFLEKAKHVETLTDKRNAYPNLVLYHAGFLFCSVHLALRKAASSEPVSRTRSIRFRDAVVADSTRVSGILTAQIAEWTRTYGTRPGDSMMSSPTLELRARLAETELARLQQSRSMRLTRPLREAARIARTTPGLRELGRFIMHMLRKVKRMVR